MWNAGKQRQDNEPTTCLSDGAVGSSRLGSLGTISDRNWNTVVPTRAPTHHSVSHDLPATVQVPMSRSPKSAIQTDTLKLAGPPQPWGIGSVQFLGQRVPLQYVQLAYRQVVWDQPQPKLLSPEQSNPKHSHVLGHGKGWSAASWHSRHVMYQRTRYNHLSNQPVATEDESYGDVHVAPALATLRLADDITVVRKCKGRPGMASAQVTAAVFISDAVGAIMQYLSRSDLAAMRLTCRTWKVAVSARVRSLTPSALPNWEACPLLSFPAVSSLDLTAIGPHRMRTLSWMLRGHVQQLTGFSIGDRQGRASWITNTDMLKVARMTALRQLSLLCPQSVNVLGFSYLKALKNLEDLRVVRCKCLAERLPIMCSAWPKLTRLDAIGCKGSIREAGPPCYWPQNLEHLHIAKESVAVLGLSDLPQFPALRHLVLAETACPLLTQPQGMPQLTLLSGLTSMCINDVIVQFDAIRAVLLALTGLISLDLTSTDTVPRQCEGLQSSLGRLPCLRSVVLTGLDVAWTIIFANVGLTSLTVNIPDLTHFTCLKDQHMISTLPLKCLKLMAVTGDHAVPACLGCLSAMTSLTLCHSRACQPVPLCGRNSTLAGTLRLLLPRLPQLQRVDLLVPTEVQVVRSICFESASLDVACLRSCCEGLQRIHEDSIPTKMPDVV